MEQLQIVLAWMKHNPWVTAAIVVYVVANLAPRPDPSKMTGWQRAFWQMIDRLCVLTHDKLPGALKMLLLDTPQKHVEPVAPPPKTDDKEEASEEESDSDDPEVDSAEVDEEEQPDEEAEPESGDDTKGAPK